MSTIPDKRTFVALQRRGLLGNYLRSWSGFEEALCAGYSGWLTVRGVNPQFKHFIPEIHMNERERFLSKAVNPKDFYVQEIPPPSSGRLVNFEVHRLPWLSLLHGKLNTEQNLRHDLQENSNTCSGIRAATMLRHWTKEDYDSLEDIWDRYPDAIIEASVFNRAVGEFKRPLVIWEVRNF